MTIYDCLGSPSCHKRAVCASASCLLQSSSDSSSVTANRGLRLHNFCATLVNNFYAAFCICNASLPLLEPAWTKVNSCEESLKQGRLLDSAYLRPFGSRLWCKSMNQMFKTRSRSRCSIRVYLKCTDPPKVVALVVSHILANMWDLATFEHLVSLRYWDSL